MPEGITAQNNRKEVYTHFGLAAYFAQSFEMKLHNLFLVHARLTDGSISLTDELIAKEFEKLQGNANHR